MESIAETGYSLAAQPPADTLKCIAACAGRGTVLLNTPVAAVRPAIPSRSRSGPPARDRVRLRRGRPGSAAPRTAGGGTAAGRHGPHRRNCLQCPASGKNYLRAAQDLVSLPYYRTAGGFANAIPGRSNWPRSTPLSVPMCRDMRISADLERMASRHRTMIQSSIIFLTPC